jgi:chitinase
MSRKLITPRSLLIMFFVASTASAVGCAVEDALESENIESQEAAVVCSSTPSWAPNVAYAVGNVVKYNGKTYSCRQSHTSLANWMPTAVPALWLETGTCTGSTTTSSSSSSASSSASSSSASSSSASSGSGGTGGTGGAGGADGGTPPPGPTSNFAPHALIGYWHNFTNPSGCAIPISQVSNNWDVIVVAFAENDPQSNGTVHFTPFAGGGGCPAISLAQFKADVAAKRAAGKIVALSLGGAEGTITLNNAQSEANFVSSLTNIIQDYGFDGIDVDLESGSGLVHGSAIQQRLVTAIKAINTNVGGNMYLSMAPEHPYVQGGVVAFSSIWGAYLPIIDGLRNELDLLHVQLYNNNSVPTPNTAEYQFGKMFPEATVDNLVVSATMLMEGFTTASGWRFNGLPASKIAFGLPSGPSSSNSPVTSNATIQNAYRCLTQKVNCGQHVPSVTYPGFRGVMTWSINWDKHDGFVFSQPLATFLHQ